MWERHGKQNFRVSVGSEDWIMISDPDDVGVISFMYITFNLKR